MSRQCSVIYYGEYGAVSSAVDESGADNTDLFLMMLQSQRQGFGCLPFRLGLDVPEYEAFKDKYQHETAVLSYLQEAEPAEDLRQCLLEMRSDEAADIRNLLVSSRKGRATSELWMAAIVAAGCMGGGHLWRDLGLRNREDLSALLNANFPELAASNTQDMKWKKFFYKQLCAQEGSYVCRAPSCEHCTTYADCFGPED
jgi:nitrogen fixation protein NifQ